MSYEHELRRKNNSINISSERLRRKKKEMAKRLDLKTMSLLVICLAISVGTSYAHDSATAPPSVDDPNKIASNNEQFGILLEKSLQVSFELFAKGKKSEAEMKLQTIGRAFLGYKSMPPEEKMAKLNEIVLKLKKTFNKETQLEIEDFLLGVQMGYKLLKAGKDGSGQVSIGGSGQVSIGGSGQVSQGGSGQVSLGGSGRDSQTSIFEKLLEQKLKIAFQIIQHGNQAEGQKMLEVIGNLVNGFKNIPREDKLEILTQLTMKIKPSLNKETQAACDEFLGGIQFAAGAKLTINTGDEESSEGPTPN